MPDPIAVNSMFSRIARRYDLANRLLSFGLDVWWRWRLVRAVHRGRPRAVLDLATGSGDVAFALARKLPAETRLLGMDFLRASVSAKILNVATNLAAIGFFAGNVELMWKLAAVMAACNLTGSILGSRMALKHGTGFVRRMFLAVVTVLILRLAYDTFLR